MWTEHNWDGAEDSTGRTHLIDVEDLLPRPICRYVGWLKDRRRMDLAVEPDYLCPRCRDMDRRMPVDVPGGGLP